VTTIVPSIRSVPMNSSSGKSLGRSVSKQAVAAIAVSKIAQVTPSTATEKICAPKLLMSRSDASVALSAAIVGLSGLLHSPSPRKMIVTELPTSDPASVRSCAARSNPPSHHVTELTIGTLATADLITLPSSVSPLWIAVLISGGVAVRSFSEEKVTTPIFFVDEYDKRTSVKLL